MKGNEDVGFGGENDGFSKDKKLCNILQHPEF